MKSVTIALILLKSMDLNGTAFEYTYADVYGFSP